MKTITAWQAGLRKADLQGFLDRLSQHGVNMHSILMSRFDKLFLECYWEPFTADTPHRMYSVTKSFVAMAIGRLADEGKLDLDDPIIRYFPDKLPPVVPELLKKQTIRHMLMMCTCFESCNWFQPHVTDRLQYYFAQTPIKPSGTLFHYDSTGSYVLGVLVERLSGMSLLDFLRDRFFSVMGGFESAEILETMDGTPWGDSGMLCTPRDLMRFARMTMHHGNWEGRQLVSPEYVALATGYQNDNNLENVVCHERCGYGYQFWMAPEGSFAFYGMGGQYAVCVPEKDFIFVCTGDNQLNARDMLPALFSALYDCVVSRLSDELLPEEEPICLPRLQLPVARGKAHSEWAERVGGKWYVCSSNPMGITRFCLTFPAEGEGVLTYENAQGEKQLPFGFGHNAFGLFPQLGYSDQRGNVHEITDFRYRCAASAGWVDENKLQINVQIIDRYLGQLVMTFGFNGTDAGVRMVKSAEDFLREYEGWMIAKMK